MKKLKTFLIATLLALLPTTILLWNLSFPMMNTQILSVYEPYENFGIVVDEFKWEGKLQPGRYTKSGILIIKQQDNGN